MHSLNQVEKGKTVKKKLSNTRICEHDANAEVIATSGFAIKTLHGKSLVKLAYLHPRVSSGVI